MDDRMEEISAKDARDHMSSILNHVAFGQKRYTLSRHGKGVAVIISLQEWKSFERILQKLEDEEDIHDADSVMERIKSGEETISHDELKRESGL